MTKILIAGSRDWSDLQQVRDFVARLPTDTEVVAGGARGVDRCAEATGRQMGFKVTVMPADWSLGKGAGMIRNQQMVNYADEVVCFHQNGSRGTQNTIDRTRAAGKPLTIFTSEGVTVRENHNVPR